MSLLIGSRQISRTRKIGPGTVRRRRRHPPGGQQVSSRGAILFGGGNPAGVHSLEHRGQAVFKPHPSHIQVVCFPERSAILDLAPHGEAATSPVRVSKTGMGRGALGLGPLLVLTVHWSSSCTPAISPRRSCRDSCRTLKVNWMPWSSGVLSWRSGCGQLREVSSLGHAPASSHAQLMATLCQLSTPLNGWPHPQWLATPQGLATPPWADYTL